MNSKGIAYAIISSATFGLIPLFSVAAMNGGQSPFSVLFYRFLFSAVLFGVFIRIKRVSFRISLKQFSELVVLGGLCYGGTALFLILSYGFIPTGIATTINFLYPVMVALIVFAIYKERPTLGIALAIVLSLIGVGLMAWSKGATLNVRGVVYALITVVTYGFYIVGLNKSSLRELNGNTVTFYVLFIAAVLFFVVAQFFGGIPAITSVRVGLNLVSLAVVATIISNLTLVLAVKAIGSTTTSVLGSMEPLTALAVGVFWFGERLTLWQTVGVMLVVASVSMVVLMGRRVRG